MRVKFNFGALRSTKPHEFAIRFFFGGAITLLAGLIADHFGPRIGGLFLAFPAIFPASVTLLAKHQKQKKQRRGLPGKERGKLAAALDARGAAMGAFALMLFALTVWLVLPRWPVAATLLLSTLVWFSSAVAIWLARQKL